MYKDDNNNKWPSPSPGLWLILVQESAIFFNVTFYIVVLIGKKNLEVRPMAVNKVQFEIWCYNFF